MTSNRVSVIAREADSVFHGGDVPHVGGEELSPEQRLWRAVLLMAWNDAFVNSDWVLAGKGSKDREVIAERERKRAIRWLTLPYGRFKEDRELVCDLAGVDADLVRRLALAKLVQVKAREKHEKADSVIDYDVLAQRARLDLDKMMEQLLRRTDDLDESDISQALAELATIEADLAASA